MTEEPQAEKSPAFESAPARALTWRMAITAGIALLLAYPLILLFVDRGAPAADTPPTAAGTPASLLNQSLQHYEAGQYQESIAAARELLKMAPDSAEAYNNLAVAYLRLGSWDEARRNAQEAIRLNPDFALARNNLAWIEQERAKASAGKVPEANRTANDFLNESLEHFRAKRFQECIAAAEKALRLNPAMAEAHNNISAAHLELKNWEEAIRAADEAIRLKPDLQLAKNNRAWAVQQKSAR